MQKLFYSIFLIYMSGMNIHAQNTATVREVLKVYPTYEFSDPDPVPSFSKLYPYFRFDGFTSNAVDKQWKIVQLENDYLRVEIMPQIGGKVWSAYDKINQQYFIYSNNTVKFRDVAMRGPWTSGGIEFNYGVIGHTPNTSTPVDYLIKTDENGSASCIIANFEMLTRTRWCVEVKLEKDKAYFTTRSFWYNTTAEDQPYYHWSNAAVSAKKDLELIYPGNAAIGHLGDKIQWPYDSVNNKQISSWQENNYEGSKSFHVVGSGKPYFGAYWRNKDYGMMHFTKRDEKLGRKMFSWALSDQGDIWEELLTDKDGQYVEMQSGRLFNQNSIPSSLTPFKQMTFVPYGADSWTEYWYPFARTGGVTDANELGVISLKDGILKISPLRFIQDTLFVKDNSGNILYKTYVNLRPLQTTSFRINSKASVLNSAVINLGEKLWQIGEQSLQRPLISPESFNWNDVYGLYIYARDLAGLRNYEEAQLYLNRCLQKDKNYVPALALMSHLQYRRMDYDSAFYFAKKALSIDTYDAQSNYYYALAAEKKASITDALDGYEVASLTSEYRSAAYTGMAKLYFRQKDYTNAFEYAAKSLINNQYNQDAWQLQFLINRLQNKNNDIIEKNIMALEPLNSFLLFEKYLNDRSEIRKKAFVNSITNEFPFQTFLELALWYHNLGRTSEAKEVLLLAPENTEKFYWLAYFNKDNASAATYLKQAELSSPTFVFPFREEANNMLVWVINNSADWKPVYYTALLQLSKNNKDKAAVLLNEIKHQPQFAPFYSTRASVNNDSATVENDLKLAVKYEEGSWRYVNALTKFYLSKHNYKKALSTIEPFYQKHKDNYISGMLYVRTLLRNDQYAAANNVLSSLKILPFEGALEGRRLYEETKLQLTLNSLQQKKYTQAINYVREARLWPRNMGVGKPYDNMIDVRAEDFMEGLILHDSGKKREAVRLFQKVAKTTIAPAGDNTLLQVLALYYIGEEKKAETLFENWKKLQKKESQIRSAEDFVTTNSDLNKDLNHMALNDFFKLISATEDERLF